LYVYKELITFLYINNNRATTEDYTSCSRRSWK